ncbi:MAG: hypothetical protein ACRELT_13760, partial [Longimicrobiales bacterium]
MGSRNVFVYYSPGGRRAPDILHAFAAQQALTLIPCGSADEVVALVNRGFPSAVVVDGEGESETASLCAQLKLDAFSAIVPIVILTPVDREDLV